MKKILTFFIGLITSINLQAQSFEIRIDSTDFYFASMWQDKIASNADGGLVIAGYSMDPWLTEAVKVVKLTTNGNIEWAKVYGSWYEVYSFEIEPTPDSGFYLTVNQVEDFPLYKARFDIIRINKYGDVLGLTSSDWSNTQSSGGVRDLKYEKETAGIHFFWDQPYLDANQELDGFYPRFCRMSSSITNSFSKSIPLIGICSHSISNGSIISDILIGGTTISNNNSRWPVVAKIDSAGTLQWKREYYGISWGTVQSILQIDSTFYLAEVGYYEKKIAIRKIDWNGSTLFYNYIDTAVNINLSTVAFEKIDTTYLVLSYLDGGFVKHLKMDLNCNIISGFKSTVKFNNYLYSGANDGVIYITARDTTAIPYQAGHKIIFKRECIDSLSCNYLPFIPSPFPGPLNDSVEIINLVSVPWSVMFHTIDTFTFSNVVLDTICSQVALSAIADNEIPEIKIYPNPAHDILTLELMIHIASSDVEIDIYDLYGNKVKNTIKLVKITDEDFKVHIDINDLASDVYLIKITVNSTSFLNRIIKI